MVSIHPVAAISYGLQEIGRLEDAGVGLVAGTISTTDSPSGHTFNKTMTSLFISTIFWGFVSFYLNRVIRSEYGQPLPWYFLCTKSYWLCGNGKQYDVDDKDLDHKVTGVPVEEVTDAVRSTIRDGKGIAICGLRKQFGEKTAVDNLYLDMYTNQITALLGKKQKPSLSLPVCDLSNTLQFYRTQWCWKDDDYINVDWHGCTDGWLRIC